MEMRFKEYIKNCINEFSKEKAAKCIFDTAYNLGAKNASIYTEVFKKHKEGIFLKNISTKKYTTKFEFRSNYDDNRIIVHLNADLIELIEFKTLTEIIKQNKFSIKLKLVN